MNGPKHNYNKKENRSRKNAEVATKSSIDKGKGV